MGLRALVLTWLLSVLPLALGWVSGGDLVLGGALQVGPVLLPWLFLAGLPRQGNRPSIGTASMLGLAAPPVALALGLDLAQGATPWTLLRFVGVGLLLVAVLSRAANLAAARDRIAARLYGVSWLLLVPLPAVVLFVRVQAGLPSEQPVPGHWTLGTSPLTLVHALARGVDPPRSAWFLAALLAAALLLFGRGWRAPGTAGGQRS